MVDISRESAAQAEQRLRRVIRQARLDVQPGTWAFQALAAGEAPTLGGTQALALVRDGAAWSQLVPCDSAGRELFAVFSLHFVDGLDNSGFVDWLATHLKRRLGTGVVVVCGFNPSDGGIFDHWCVPAVLAAKVIGEVRALMTVVP